MKYIISNNSKPLIISEVGINHNGDIIAKQLIDSLKKRAMNL